MAESNLQRQIQKAASALGARLFRNNTGLGWASSVKPIVVKTPQRIAVGPGDVILRRARPLHAGLCVGSSDLIGWTPHVVTADDVGRTLAVFTGVEVKDGAARTPEQIVFASVVLSCGGRAGFATSVAAAIEICRGQ